MSCCIALSPIHSLVVYKRRKAGECLLRSSRLTSKFRSRNQRLAQTQRTRSRHAASKTFTHQPTSINMLFFQRQPKGEEMMRTANMSGPLVQLGGVTYVNMVSFSSLPFSPHSPPLPCFSTYPLASSPLPLLRAYASLPDLRWARRIQRTGGAQRHAPRPPTESQHAHNRARPDRR